MNPNGINLYILRREEEEDNVRTYLYSKELIEDFKVFRYYKIKIKRTDNNNLAIIDRKKLVDVADYVENNVIKKVMNDTEEFNLICECILKYEKNHEDNVLKVKSSRKATNAYHHVMNKFDNHKKIK